MSSVQDKIKLWNTLGILGGAEEQKQPEQESSTRKSGRSNPDNDDEDADAIRAAARDVIIGQRTSSSSHTTYSQTSTNTNTSRNNSNSRSSRRRTVVRSSAEYTASFCGVLETLSQEDHAGTLEEEEDNHEEAGRPERGGRKQALHNRIPTEEGGSTSEDSTSDLEDVCVYVAESLCSRSSLPPSSNPQQQHDHHKNHHHEEFEVQLVEEDETRSRKKNIVRCGKITRHLFYVNAILAAILAAGFLVGSKLRSHHLDNTPVEPLIINESNSASASSSFYDVHRQHNPPNQQGIVVTTENEPAPKEHTSPFFPEVPFPEMSSDTVDEPPRSSVPHNTAAAFYDLNSMSSSSDSFDDPEKNDAEQHDAAPSQQQQQYQPACSDTLQTKNFSGSKQSCFWLTQHITSTITQEQARIWCDKRHAVCAYTCGKEFGIGQCAYLSLLSIPVQVETPTTTIAVPTRPTTTTIQVPPLVVSPSPPFSHTTTTTTATTIPPVVATYRPGNLTHIEVGLWLSEGLHARLVATFNEPVAYTGTTLTMGTTQQNQFVQQHSEKVFHEFPDGAETFPDPRPNNIGGWIYVSNSEVPEDGGGGVGAITFNKEGNVIDYSKLLDGTTMNCGGGPTPWQTWISCEEVEKEGQIYQIDPTGHQAPQLLTLGIDGGRWESFAYDVRNRTAPHFFVTEDVKKGTVRRYTPEIEEIDWTDDATARNMLHGNGTTDYLLLIPPDNMTHTGIDRGTFLWTDDIKAAKNNARSYYPETEGIDVDGSQMYLVCKNIRQMFVLNLDEGTYYNQTTESGLFDGKPDQLQRILDDPNDILYFTEEGGKDAVRTVVVLFLICLAPCFSNLNDFTPTLSLVFIIHTQLTSSILLIFAVLRPYHSSIL